MASRAAALMTYCTAVGLDHSVAGWRVRHCQPCTSHTVAGPVRTPEECRTGRQSMLTVHINADDADPIEVRMKPRQDSAIQTERYRK